MVKLKFLTETHFINRSCFRYISVKNKVKIINHIMEIDKEKLEYLNKECKTNYTSLNEVNWNYISIHKIFSEDFIREFANEVNWYYISKYQYLSEDFIREFQNKVDWFLISKFQTLSEDFIREFQNNVEWEMISKYQNLSEDFLREFKNRIHWRTFLIREDIIDIVINKIIN